MVNVFNNKRILIISPEKWNDLRLSKHNYALELARAGNEVFFLNPPETVNRNPEIVREVHKNLWVVDYNTHIKGERFWPLKLLKPIRQLQSRRLIKKVGKIDVIWSFFPNQFHDLRIFSAEISIFHPVDKVLNPRLRKTATTADFVFSVAEFLLADFRSLNHSCYFVDHGLSVDYEKKAVQLLDSIKDDNSIEYTSKKLTVGYVGNLLRGDIDRKVLKQIIESNQHIDFIFWGPFKYEHLNWEHPGVKEVIDFIDYLFSLDNVQLRGLTPPNEIINQTKNVDAFLCCYNPKEEINRASNNHKVMEYLSTGKVVISHHIETYRHRPGLLEMVDEYTNQNLPGLFVKVLNNLTFYNSPDFQRRRIEFALQNTYARQLERIQTIINDANIRKQK